MTSYAVSQAPWEAPSHKVWTANLVAGTLPEPGHGALLGKQWEARLLAEALYDAGFGCTANSPALDLLIMLCVGLAESQGFDRAVHVNLNNTIDRGWLQLSSVHAEITDDEAYDIREAARAAKVLVDAKKRAGGEGFEDWVAFTHVVGGAAIFRHDTYLSRAGRGAGNFLIDVLLNEPVPDVGQAYPTRLKTPVLNFEHRVAGASHWIKQAQTDLGWQAATKDKVALVRSDLSRGLNAAKQPLPN